MVSPEVTHTGTGPTGYTVTFRYHAPTATRVQIRGEWGLRSVADPTTRPPSQYRPGDFFNEAQTSDMVLDPATGVWSYTTPLPPGTWSYAFQPTPNCAGCPAQLTDPMNLPFNQVGGTTEGTVPQWSQVYVPQDPAFSPDGRPLQAPVPAAQRGRLAIQRYPSPGATTCATVILCVSPAGQHDLAVYTPPGYDPNRAVPYPTLYLSHGGSGSEVDWATQGAAGTIVDNLIASGKLQPAVVVMTNFNGLPSVNGSAEEGYVRDLLDNVIPFVESRYRVSTQGNDRAFGGLSAGGGRAGVALFKYPTTFGYYGIWSSTAAFGPAIDMSHPDARTRLALHVGIGIQDPGVARHEGLARLAASDIPHVRDDVNGVHSWDVWRQELAIFAAEWAFRHTTTTVGTSGTTVTATVRASTTSPTAPTGTVQFSAGGQPLGGPVAVVGGTATLAVPSTGGASAITATYSGDALYNTSTGSAAYASTSTTGTVGGTVPATLSLTLGTVPSFGAFTPGVAREYMAQGTASVTSTAGDAALTVSDPSSTAPGHLVNGAFSLPQPLKAAGSTLPATIRTWTTPVTSDPVPLAFSQSIGATDALRTGTYSKTLTFTLSTTMP